MTLETPDTNDTPQCNESYSGGIENIAKYVDEANKLYTTNSSKEARDIDNNLDFALSKLPGAAPWIENGTKRDLRDKGGNSIENAYGHLPYYDCPANDLTFVNGKNGIEVHKDTLEAFQKMQHVAKKAGCNLVIVSGFRSKEYQYGPFTKNKRASSVSPRDIFEKMTIQEKQERAKWSAIPGYSEHHTGYAIDIVSTDTSFGDTKEYTRLKENANKFGFELSFPENNQQGIGFEPRHWRYVGSDTAKKVFAKAQSL